MRQCSAFLLLLIRGSQRRSNPYKNRPDYNLEFMHSPAHIYSDVHDIVLTKSSAKMKTILGLMFVVRCCSSQRAFITNKVNVSTTELSIFFRSLNVNNNEGILRHTYDILIPRSVMQAKALSCFVNRTNSKVAVSIAQQYDAV
jgi:hypothetical protein